MVVKFSPIAFDLDAFYAFAPDMPESFWEGFRSMPCGDHVTESILDAHVTECLICQHQLA